MHAIRKKNAQKARASSGGLDDEREKTIQEKFDEADTDGGGSIDADELIRPLKNLGYTVTSPQCARFIKEFKSGNALGLESFTILVRALILFNTDPFVRSSIRGKNKPLPGQAAVRALYLHPAVVWSVAGVIIANFVVNILEKELDPDVNFLQYPQTWENLDIAFNVIFLIELLVNMYGYGGPVRAFWRNGWNVFDFLIVVVGVVLMTGIELGNLSKLKLLRAFRVFRLFKRIKSLNKIIVSLLLSVPGVTNAFVILFIFFCIYAILAVELFRDFGLEGTYMTNDLDNVSHVVSSITARGCARPPRPCWRLTPLVASSAVPLPCAPSPGPRAVGELLAGRLASRVPTARLTGSSASFDSLRADTNGIEYYGTYTRAMYTLFQVMTGESWSEAVARPLLFGLYQESTLAVGLFYVSFVILTQMVLINVVVAVLLDKMVTPPEAPLVAEMDEELENDFVLFLRGLLDAEFASSGSLANVPVLLESADDGAAKGGMQGTVVASPGSGSRALDSPAMSPGGKPSNRQSMETLTSKVEQMDASLKLLHKKLDMLLSAAAPGAGAPGVGACLNA